MATFCSACGRSLRGSGGRLLGRLACSGLLVFGFVILLASLAPLLVSQAVDWTSATGIAAGARASKRTRCA